MSDLTTLQQRFVEEYVGEANFNATEAAALAGYKGNRNTLGAIGSQNLRKLKIAEAIEARLEDLSMSAAEATKRMTDIARSDFADFYTIEEDEETGRKYARLDLTRLMEEGPSHLVKKIKGTKYGPTIEGYDAQRALETIMKAHGIFGAKGTEEDPLHQRVEARIEIVNRPQQEGSDGDD